MTARNTIADDERGLRIIEALHGEPEDVELDPPANPASLARIQVAIDDAFDRAWRAAREHAKAAASRSVTRRDDLLGLTRDALVAKIQAWQRQLGPKLQVAHRDLDHVSDDDLRTMLADLEELAERRGVRA